MYSPISLVKASSSNARMSAQMIDTLLIEVYLFLSFFESSASISIAVTCFAVLYNASVNMPNPGPISIIS